MNGHGAALGADPATAVGGRRRLDNFQHVSDLGAGNFGVAKLMLDRTSNQLVAVKFIERGGKIDRNVEREIMNHSTLNHPNIVSFREVFLTPTHLAIVMEYAAGGELFDRIVRAGRFSEDEARFFFQQLVSGVDYCHQLGVCHRDLKLENTLLDNNPAPRLKICDFGYSKSAMDSQPKSTVGTPAYIAPEVLQRKEYSGQTADVWSCGVTLYVMLVGAYPFEDPGDPRNFRKTIQRIMAVQYQVPPELPISAGCKDLLGRIFVAAPQQRITMAQIKQHPWFLKNLPIELSDPSRTARNPDPVQSQDQIRQLIHAARELEPLPGAGGRSRHAAGAGVAPGLPSGGADGFDDDDGEGGHHAGGTMADELNDSSAPAQGPPLGHALAPTLVPLAQPQPVAHPQQLVGGPPGSTAVVLPVAVMGVGGVPQQVHILHPAAAAAAVASQQFLQVHPHHPHHPHPAQPQPQLAYAGHPAQQHHAVVPPAFHPQQVAPSSAQQQLQAPPQPQHHQHYQVHYHHPVAALHQHQQQQQQQQAGGLQPPPLPHDVAQLRPPVLIFPPPH